MSVLITLGFFLQVFSQGLRQVSPGLVGNTDQYEEHVGEFVFELGFFGVLERLFSIAPAYDSGQLDRKSVV